MKNIKSLKSKTLHLDAKKELKEIAAFIQLARKRRKLSLQNIADKSGVSTASLSRIEAGDPSVGVGAILQVLSVLHLVKDISKVLSPENDLEAVLSEVRDQRLQVKKGKVFTDEDLDF